jgi:outer membrane protein OmpA-like peptidoglycan-associated protein
MAQWKNLRTLSALACCMIALGVLGGCATKGYVNEQVSALGNRVDTQDSSMRSDISRTEALAQGAESEAARSKLLALGHLDYRTVEQYSVPFEYDSAELEGDAMMALDQVTSTVEAHPNYIVDLLGHACSIGPTAYNEELSRRRANAVLHYLVEHGPGPVGRYAIVGLGESMPVLAEGDEDHSASRRVEVRVLEKVESGTAPKKEPVVSQLDHRTD